MYLAHKTPVTTPAALWETPESTRIVAIIRSNRGARGAAVLGIAEGPSLRTLRGGSFRGGVA